jgi:hypothetical protein
MSIAIGLPTGGAIRWETTWSLVEAARLGAFEQFRVCAGVVYVDDARNHLVRWFLDETDCEYFLSLDSDISFLPTDLHVLEADGLDCVSGVYYNIFDGVLKPVAKFLDTIPDVDEPVLEVEGVGAGFLMASRTLLEKMRAEYGEPVPWFAEPVVEGEHYGEDFGFCRRVRELGSAVHLDLRVQLSHYKTVRVTGPGTTAPPIAGPGR